MSKQTNILIFSPDRNDATSMYRAWGVFPALRKHNSLNINNLAPLEVSWSILSDVDIVFMQRPFREDHLRVAKMVKDYGIPLWVDFDDLLWDIDKSSPVYAFYKANGSGEPSKKCAEIADFVTVSTDKLKGIVTELNENVITIPNAINDYWWPLTEFPERKDIIVWRGSSTHNKDWDSVLPEWKRFLLDYGHAVEVVFIGEPYWKAVELAEQYASASEHVLGMDYVKYMNYLYELQAKVLIHPLANTEFNQCKSNVAWIEAGAVGTVCVAPDMPEWDGAYRYGDGKFYDTLVTAIQAENHESNQEAVYLTRSLSEVNKKRAEIIRVLRGV